MLKTVLIAQLAIFLLFFLSSAPSCILAQNSTNSTNSTGNSTVPPAGTTGTSSIPPETTSASNATPAPVVVAEVLNWRRAGPIDIRPLRNVTCPFSRWQGDLRDCLECRWCPFKKSACCEMEDEISTLKSINVSGATDWDCFITIMHFQQCGRCSPDSRKLLMNKTLNYIWDPRGMSIRPCKQACRYIYGQCSGVTTLVGEPIVPDGVDEDAFCQDYPELDSEEVPCFNSAGRLSSFAMIVLVVVLVLILHV